MLLAGFVGDLFFCICGAWAGAGEVVFRWSLGTGNKMSQSSVTNEFSAGHQQESHQWYVDCHPPFRKMVVMHGSSEVLQIAIWHISLGF